MILKSLQLFLKNRKHDSKLKICKNSIGNKTSSGELVAQFVQMTQHWRYIHLLNMAITFLSLITTVSFIVYQIRLKIFRDKKKNCDSMSAILRTLLVSFFKFASVNFFFLSFSFFKKTILLISLSKFNSICASQISFKESKTNQRPIFPLQQVRK